MNTIKDIAKESYISWGVIAGKIDDNFRELAANVEEASDAINNLDLTAYKDADASLKQDLVKYVDDAIKDINIPEVNHNCEYAAADASLEAALKSYTITEVQGVREYVNEKIGGIKVPSLDGYAKLEDIPVMPNLDEYAKLEDIPEVPSLEGYARLEDIPVIPSLDEYAKLEDIPEVPSLEGYARLEDIPSIDGFVTAKDVFNNVYTKTEVDSSIAEVKNSLSSDVAVQIAALKIGDYAKTIYVDEQISAARTFASTYTDNAIKEYADNVGSNSTSQVQMFIGTIDEYASAKNAGTISTGSLVLILSDDESNELGSQDSTAVLGRAILGALKLNNL